MSPRKRPARAAHISGGADLRIGALFVREMPGLGPRAPFNVLRVSLKPGASHAPIVHRRTFEFFIVVKGAMVGKIDGRARAYEKGDFAALPPGSVHEFRAGRGGVQVLCVFSPPLSLHAPDVVAA